MRSEAARFAARVRAERRRRRRRLLRLAGAVAGPPVLVAGLAFSPLCDVESVAVTGTRRVAVDRVRRVAGVAPGVPLATVDLDAVRRRVRGITGVKDAQVTRAWPGTVEIRVVERQPALAVPLGATGVALYDAEGHLVAHAGIVPTGVPLLRPTGTRAPDRELVAAAVAVVRALPAPLRARLTGLRAASTADLAFTLRDGVEVVWGDAEPAGEKLRALRALLRTGARRIDLRAPGVPAVR